MKVIDYGDIVKVAPPAPPAAPEYTELAVGLYNLNFHPMEGYYLVKRDPFILPPKIYGHSSFPARVLDTFAKIGKGIGVLMSGPKGTGKTVEAKIICRNSGLPVIMLTSGHSGDSLTAFLESIPNKCIIFIDEFEKIYEDEQHRNYFLSVMDGVAKSRHLFLLTSNNDNIGEFFDSRPGRVRYHKKYEHLDDTIIQEIVKDKLENKDNIPAVMRVFNKMSNLSVDAATCMIEECNLHNEVPSDFMSFFNVRNDRPSSYEVELNRRELHAKKFRLKADREKADAVAWTFNRMGQLTEGWEKYAEMADVQYIAKYVDPFYDVGEDEELAKLIVNRLYNKENSDQVINLDWKIADLVQFSESRKGFTAINKRGDVFVGKPMKFSARSFWD